jgi:hypothetical protein
VDAQGLELNAEVLKANVFDRDGIKPLLKVVEDLFLLLSHPWLDAGYKSMCSRRGGPRALTFALHPLPTRLVSCGGFSGFRMVKRVGELVAIEPGKQYRRGSKEHRGYAGDKEDCSQPEGGSGRAREGHRNGHQRQGDEEVKA